MVDVGDVAMKIAGRDAGKVCVVVDTLDGNFVLIDGDTRRRKCNLEHLEFLGKKVKVKKGSSTDEVKKALKDSGFAVLDVKKGKKKERKERQIKLRVSKKKTEVVEDKNSKKKK